MGRRSSALFVALLVAVPAESGAMEGKVTELRAERGTVRAALSLSDALPQNLRTALEQGATLHLRVQAELWEDRVWDRLVRPAAVTAFRLSRQHNSKAVSIADVTGGLTTYPDYPDPLIVRIDVAPANLLQEAARYYLSAVVIVGTLAEGEMADAGTAVFGKDDGSVGFKSAGRFILNTVLRVTDYMQSVSTTFRSQRYVGRDIKTR